MAMPTKTFNGIKYRLFGTRVLKLSAYFNKSVLEGKGYHVVVEKNASYKIWACSRRSWEDQHIAVRGRR